MSGTYLPVQIFIILGMPCHCKQKHVFRNNVLFDNMSSPNDTGMSVVLRTMILIRSTSEIVDN